MIKGQVLANFIAKFTLAIGDAHRMCQVLVQPCKVYVDGASNARGFRTGIVLKSLKGIRVEDSLNLGFQTSNNEAKYEALVARLQVVVKVKATEVEIFWTCVCWLVRSEEILWQGIQEWWITLN